jgi:hypothetical protein
VPVGKESKHTQTAEERARLGKLFPTLSRAGLGSPEVKGSQSPCTPAGARGREKGDRGGGGRGHAIVKVTIETGQHIKIPILGTL